MATYYMIYISTEANAGSIYIIACQALLAHYIYVLYGDTKEIYTSIYTY